MFSKARFTHNIESGFMLIPNDHENWFVKFQIGFIHVHVHVLHFMDIRF